MRENHSTDRYEPAKNVTGTNSFPDTSEQAVGGANLKIDISDTSSFIATPSILRCIHQGGS
jgi:hypothetical protein